MKHLLAAIFLLAASLAAQTVSIVNQSALPWQGWHRTTVDSRPPHRFGVVETADGFQAHYALGRQTGLDTFVLDLKLALAPKQELVLDLAKSRPWVWKVTALPAQHTDWFGGQVSIAGVQMKRLALDQDGAGYTGHWRARSGPMLLVDLWITWYPDQPALAHGEALVTASNPTVPDLHATVPASFAIKIGKAQVFALGALSSGGPLVAAGTVFGDGQSRVVPLVLVFLDKLTSDEVWSCAGASIHRKIVACGISKLWPVGNPRSNSSNARAWAAELLPEAVRRLSTWEGSVIGPNKRSGDTGAQGGQGWPYGEPLLPDGTVGVDVVYLSGCQMAARPCHHRELDGAHVTPELHPQLVMWDGRAHWHEGVSPDRLGKPAGAIETYGWWGPDVEHWIATPQVAGARLTGSKALQALLNTQAYLYLFTHTVDPRLIYPSQPFAPRATFYEGQNAVLLWTNLENRALAEQVKARWQARVVQVIAPAYRDVDVWSWLDDPRLGGGTRWMPWQQGGGSYGLDLGCTILGPADIGRPVAVRAAAAVLKLAYVNRDGRWTSLDAPDAAGTSINVGSYDFFMTPFAWATVLRNDPVHKLATIIARQNTTETTDPSHTRWFAPEVK